jgi:hypothetical protein
MGNSAVLVALALARIASQFGVASYRLTIITAPIC